MNTEASLDNLPPEFHGALADATTLAATFGSAGLVMYLCDTAASLDDFPARTWTGGMSGVHAIAAIDAIVNVFIDCDHPPVVAKALADIQKVIRKAGGTMDSSAAHPIKPTRNA